MAHIDENAPAKINLTLTVRGRQPDGYHGLESLVAFADIGDRLLVEKADTTAFALKGPFGAALAETPDSDNLVVRAQAALEQETGRKLPATFMLHKNLPVASGLGGGSADAAACLRGLAEAYGLEMSTSDMHRLALGLGADVPVCLASQTVWMSGIGDTLTPLPAALPSVDIVLVNPLVGLATAEVFASAGFGSVLRDAQNPPARFEDLAALCSFLTAQGNDLQTAAQALQPVIADCLAALAGPQTLYAAMSGSGASCFALTAPGDGAGVAAAYGKKRPQDWVRAGVLT